MLIDTKIIITVMTPFLYFVLLENNIFFYSVYFLMT